MEAMCQSTASLSPLSDTHGDSPFTSPTGSLTETRHVGINSMGHCHSISYQPIIYKLNHCALDMDISFKPCTQASQCLIVFKPNNRRYRTECHCMTTRVNPLGIESIDIGIAHIDSLKQSCLGDI